MNTSLAQFMKIAVTAIVIIALLFSVGYSMIDTKTSEYETEVSNLPMPETSGSENR
ncbi:succinate dehydrogenase hydrophobic anchor subunit [Evansella vedderi]|uniref:Succinate dehydrogenase hydrophobic anchor subunit n=1 Tax=Evansella vedderi TaxID=38282 RepID=A0ABT9ZW66_9BACI|nr:hypothetical protein [Evansella vedderi]MDQ0255483.1 succinate dehydrogenase hydrophobic anchor subunit [Evansella vedderi]